MSVRLEPHDEGLILPVKAQPGARRNGLAGAHDSQLKVSVTQSAEKGKANGAIVLVLCKALGLRKSQIELLVGETSSRKRFLIRGVAAVDLEQRVRAALSAGR